MIYLIFIIGFSFGVFLNNIAIRRLGDLNKIKLPIECWKRIFPIYCGIISSILYYIYGINLEFILMFLVINILNLVAICDLYDNSIYILDLSLLFTLYLINLIVHKMNLHTSVIGGIFGILIFTLIYFLSKKSIGEGDIYLAGVVSFISTDLFSVIKVLGYSFVIGAIVSIILIALKKKRINDYIAFGPFLVLSFQLLFFLKML